MSMALSSPEIDVAPCIRRRQAIELEQNVARSIIGILIVAPLTTALFWHESGRILWIWCFATMVACVGRAVLAHHRLRRATSPEAILTLRWCGTMSFCLSLIIHSGPILIQWRSDGLVSSYMLALSIGIFWCGAFAHSAVRSAAAGFILANFTLQCASSFLVGMNYDRTLMLVLFGIGVAMAFYITREQAEVLKKSLHQQIDLENQRRDLQKQAEVIGLLLKEHEDQSSDWLWQTDEALRIQRPSPRFSEAFGLPPAAMEGVPLAALLSRSGQPGSPDALSALTEKMRGGRSFRDLVVPDAIDGSPRWWSVSGHPTFDQDGGLAGYRGVMADVTAARLAQSQVAHMAHHDALTDLPNRAYFRQRCDTALRALGGSRLAVLTIDLDGFKAVNDRYGHPVGDALLIAVAERLRAATSGADLVARLGGDEFAVKIRMAEPQDMEALCRNLLRSLSETFHIDGADITVGASIGVAFAPQDGDTTDALVKNSDAALYRAKNDGRGTFCFFAPEMDHRLEERLILLQDLRDALPRGELVLHYQPFVDAETGAVTGCEALIRWHHPTRGTVPPMDFIPLAEESGLIVPIGAWVIETACAEAATWPGDRRVSVNISPVQFRDRDLPDQILSALRGTGLPAHRLEVEVTETVLVGDAEAALEVLRRIGELGVRVALDDFGTGYSSLSYLRSFPFDKIKIDRSFVRELGTRRDSQVIVQAIRDIARGLGMTITAEGVETAEQARLLRLTGCQELQGFLYSRPRPAADLASMLDQRFAA